MWLGGAFADFSRELTVESALGWPGPVQQVEARLSVPVAWRGDAWGAGKLSFGPALDAVMVGLVSAGGERGSEQLCLVRAVPKQPGTAEAPHASRT